MYESQRLGLYIEGDEISQVSALKDVSSLTCYVLVANVENVRFGD
jgi:hypothetical protein